MMVVGGLYEVSIIACEPKECANVGWHLWYGIVCNSFEFLGVHAKLSFANDDSQVFDLSLFKGAFFWFEIKIMALQIV
jgi:hypothetical protein